MVVLCWLILNAASREELLSIGWISMRDVDAMLQYRGPQGQLSQSQMARLVSLDEERLGDLVGHGIVAVQWSDDVQDMNDTHSITSAMPSIAGYERRKSPIAGMERGGD